MNVLQKRKKIYIVALHLSYGGVEKAICNMANIFIQAYDVEIICMYHLPNTPAYDIDQRVVIRYLLKEIPNKNEFKAAVKQKNILRILKEGCKSVQILYKKKKVLKSFFKELQHGIVITTRNEDSVLLSKYGNKDVYKIAQLHHDHNFNQKYIHDFKYNYQQIDVFVLLTEGLRKEVSEFMKENHHTKCICIPNFLDDYPSVNLMPREPYMMSVGRLDPVKGFERLIDIMKLVHKQHPEWKLRLVGDGNEEVKLKNLVKDADLSRVIIFEGRKTTEEIQEMNQQAAMFLMTSYSEGLPFVLIEAASCSLPMIAFDVRVGPGAVIQDGVNGYLIPDGEMNTFANAVNQLIEDEQKRLHMGELAYESAKRFSKEVVTSQWFSVLNEGDLYENR